MLLIANLHLGGRRQPQIAARFRCDIMAKLDHAVPSEGMYTVGEDQHITVTVWINPERRSCKARMAKGVMRENIASGCRIMRGNVPTQAA